jgi:protein-tyrosine phosphatase
MAIIYMQLFEVSKINNCKIYISSCPEVSKNGSIKLPKFNDLEIVLISLLENREAKFLKLEDESEEAKKVYSEFIHFPIPDMGIPVYKVFVTFIDLMFFKTQHSKKIIIHCKHGIGRSGLIALGLMVKDGNDLIESIKTISKIRGYDIPQSRSQRKLISLYYKNINFL